MEHLEIRQADQSDIQTLVEQTKSDLWAKDNEMKQYKAEVLEQFFQDSSNKIYVAMIGEQIAGLALCFELLHPDGEEFSLYVHELDTHPDFRRQAVATKLMNHIRDDAKTRGISEVWLTTEADNDQANAFYKNLNASSVEAATLYSFE